MKEGTPTFESLKVTPTQSELSSRQAVLDGMSQKLTDLKAKTEQKEELLVQLTNRLAAVNAERAEKDQTKVRLRTKLSIRMGLKAPTEILRIQRDRTVLFPLESLPFPHSQ